MSEHRSSNGPNCRTSANKRLAFGLLGLTVFMIGLSFAAVPLYRIFCQVTGYGGTTQRAEAGSDTVLERTISVRFDGNAASSLGWGFRPAQERVTLKIGENRLAFYEAVNRTGDTVTGTATFNVTPEIAGAYFSKIDCFCFTQQTLKPGQEVDMPVSFFIDPAIMDDPDARTLEEITLSYTFFKVPEGDKAAAAPAEEGAARRSFEEAKRPG